MDDVFEKKNIGVLGAGTWGYAVARHLSNAGHDVTLWSKLPKEILSIESSHGHPNLPGSSYPENIKLTLDLEEAVSGKDLLFFGTASPYIRSTAEEALPFISDGTLVVNLAKGIEDKTMLSMSDVLDEVINKDRVKKIPVGVLSGPTHAEEVAIDLPTAIIAAFKDISDAEVLQDAFTTDRMKVYASDDVDGVELCGALKNIIAIAVGISAGLGYGDNAKAALITKGIHEICLLGTVISCKEKTFYDLAGIGDLIVTATSEHSRNFTFGKLIGSGKSSEEAFSEIGMVVEGMNALPAALEIADKYNLDIPIIRAVDSLVYNKDHIGQVVLDLMRN